MVKTKKNIILEEILNQYNNNLGKDLDADKSFEYFSAEQLLKDENLDIEEIETGLIGSGNDNGIDGFFILLDHEIINDIGEIDIEKKYNNLTVHFHQYKNSYKISEDVVLKFNNAFSEMLDFENELLQSWNEEAKEKIFLLRNIILKTASSGISIQFYINHVSKGKKEDIDLNDSYNNKVTNLISTINNAGISKVKIDYKFIGGDQLKDLSNKNPDYSIDLPLKDSPLTLEFGENNIGYIALVSLKNYYNFIVDEEKNLRRHLFDSNVRDYQNKTTVNKEIEESIKVNSQIDFWWLNNGVTMIASKESSQIGKKLSLKNVQIVNGLQTSYSIYHAINELDINDDRSIFIKIIICDEKEIIDKIIRSTNSQNAISSSLLRSTDSIQRDIEQFFHSKGYYYDRRKNYYRNMGKPRNKIISINLLSQCVVSLILSEKNPSRARSNPTILTKSDEDYKKIFDNRISFQAYLNSVLIYKKVEKELKDYLNSVNYSKGTDQEKLLKLYKFHISRIVVSLLTNKVSPVYGDLNGENLVDDINSEIVIKAIDTITVIYYKYKESNTQTIENIAKQTEFSKFITANISSHLQS